MNHCSENKIIICGLLVIDIVIIIGYFMMNKADKPTADAIVLMAASISSGLIGYMSRGLSSAGTPADPISTKVENNKNDPVHVEEIKDKG